jgi:hypothetical protein
MHIYKKQPKTKAEKAIRSSSISATDCRRPQGITTEEQGKDARNSSSNEEPSSLGTSKPPGTNHLAAKKHRAPAAEAMKGIHVGG